jgi:(heptosyl)LPS beta-1,4-glucosyltransferase
MPTITAVVHTRNSASTLDLCLRSVAWCDEIFVVDMGSTDKTVDIAKKYGAKVFEVKTAHQYADPIRNDYLKKVKTDWTLIVDSDEEVPRTLAEKLKDLMNVDGINGYSLPRKNIVFDRWMQHTGYWPDYIVRFFRTGLASYPPQVHAQPIVDGRHEFLSPEEKFALVHHHYNTIFEFMNRLNVYTSLEVEKLTKHGKVFHPTEALREFFAELHRRFFQMEGYKDGSYGLVLSLLSGVYQMVSYLKAWEVSKSESAIKLDDVEDEITSACDATSYWVANEDLVTEKRPLNKFFLKLKRKLHS